MEKTKIYENYPSRIICLSTLFSIIIYALGSYIMLQFGLLFLIFYLIYCFWLEIKLLKGACVNCYYYGKYCAFGKGKLSALFFKKGDQKSFTQKEFTPKDLLPDFLVFIVPLLGGLILLIRNFNWPLVIILGLLVLLSFVGNAVIRGSFACKYCKQKELHCPAEKLFRKEKKK